MKQWSTLMLARSGVIAALYAALTFVCLPVASGAIQFRLSEMLTVLPLFYPEAVPALAIGCLVSNLISGCTGWDILFGTLITLVAAIGTFLIGKVVRNHALRVGLGGLFPVVLNALFLPLIWILAGASDPVYLLEVVYLLLSQGVIVWGLGGGLYSLFLKLFERKLSFLQPIGSTVRKK